MSAYAFDSFAGLGLNDHSINKIIGKIGARESVQTVAADNTGAFICQVTELGQIGDCFVVWQALPGTGETMAYVVKRNGTNIMLAGAAYTVDATLFADKDHQVSLLPGIDPDKVSHKVGDVYTVDRDYTAGGGPTPIGMNSVVIEPSRGPYH